MYAATETESVWKAALADVKNETIFSANNASAATTVNKKFINNISLLPNPASNYITVKYNSKVLSPAEITVINMKGTVLKRMPVTVNAGENNFNVDVNTLSPGNYIIHLKTTNNMLAEKF